MALIFMLILLGSALLGLLIGGPKAAGLCLIIAAAVEAVLIVSQTVTI